MYSTSGFPPCSSGAVPGGRAVSTEGWAGTPAASKAAAGTLVIASMATALPVRSDGPESRNRGAITMMRTIASTTPTIAAIAPRFRPAGATVPPPFRFLAAASCSAARF